MESSFKAIFIASTHNQVQWVGGGESHLRDAYFMTGCDDSKADPRRHVVVSRDCTGPGQARSKQCEVNAPGQVWCWDIRFAKIQASN